MPKEALEISKFTSGTISTPSDTDVPDDAATWSMNIDPVAEDGKLMSVEEDLVLTESGFEEESGNLIIHPKKMEILSGDTEDLLFYNKPDNENATVGRIVDFNANPPSLVDINTHVVPNVDTDNIAMASNNREVHFGLGPFAANEPRWAGYVQHEGLGQSDSGVYEVEKAALTSVPSGLENNMHKVVRIVIGGVHYLYGFIWKDRTLYRGEIDMLTGTVSNWGVTYFNFEDKIIAMCTDTVRLYLMFEEEGNRIFNINLSTGSTIDTYAYSGGISFPPNTEISDLHFSQDNYVLADGNINFWVAGYRAHQDDYDRKVFRSELNGRENGLLFCSSEIAYSDIDSASAELTWTNVTPTLDDITQDGVGTDNGGWGAHLTEETIVYDSNMNPTSTFAYSHNKFPDDMQTTASPSGYVQPYFKQTFKLSLVTIGPLGALNCVGWLCRYSYSGAVIDVGGGSQPTFRSWNNFPVKFSSNTPAEDSYYRVQRNDNSSGIGSYRSTLSMGETINTVKLVPVTGYRTGGTVIRSSGVLADTILDSAVNSVATQIAGSTGNSYIWAGVNNQVQWVQSYVPGPEANQPIYEKLVFVNSNDPGENNGQYDHTAPFDVLDSTLKRVLTFCPANGSNRIDCWSAGATDRGDFIVTTDLSGVFKIEFSEQHAGTAGFSTDKKYYWKFSLTYDGYQETPLSFFIINTTGGTDYNYIVIKIVISDNDLVPRRVSHINLYRAEGPSSDADPIGFYRHTKSIPIKDFEDSANAELLFTDYEPKKGASYEARTGMSEVLSSTIVHYGLSTKLNGYLFVGNCWQRTLGDAKNYIFRSKLGKFDMFNWVEEFLVLPSTPTALTAFQGRLYAFDRQNTYRIDPNNLVIEDVFEGVGCAGPNAVAVTEYGMCFADENNIYLHDGNNPVAIGDSILKGERSHEIYSLRLSAHSELNAWQTGRDKSFKPLIAFDGKRNSFCCFFKNGDGDFDHDSYGTYDINGAWNCWSYNLRRRRWDLWEYSHAYGSMANDSKITYGAPVSVKTDLDGYILVSSIQGKLVKYHSHPIKKRKWSWYSKRFVMGQPTQTKVLKNIKFLCSHDFKDTWIIVLLNNQILGYSEEFKEFRSNDWFPPLDNSQTNIYSLAPKKDSGKARLSKFNEIRIMIIKSDGYVETIQEETMFNGEEVFYVPKTIDSIGIVFKRKTIK